MRTLIFLVSLVSAAVLGGCEADPVVQPAEPVPLAWREGITFIDATNIPQVQINRFVAANNMDTVQTASGLVFQIDDPGGDVKPTVDSIITVNYKGYLVNGRVFDQTYEGRPLTIGLDSLIPAWREGLPYLGAGGRMWMLARPSLAYSNNAPPNTGITRETVLVFELELVEP